MIRQIKVWMARRKVYRQTYKELNALSNYELKDMGLSRAAVEQIALEAAYGKKARYV
jgi:uncharacterized protein YjiS (DUF1127 family)